VLGVSKLKLKCSIKADKKRIAMMKPIRIILILLFAGYLTAVPCANAQDKAEPAEKRINSQLPYPRKWTM
jgi:hypothetical protein